MIRLSAWMAIAAGALLGVAQLARNYDNWDNWQTWMIDEAAAVAMIVAGLMALRRRMTRLLPVAWSFALGLYVASFVGHWSALKYVDGEVYASEQRLLMIVGALVVISLAGILMTLFARRDAT